MAAGEIYFRDGRLRFRNADDVEQTPAAELSSHLIPNRKVGEIWRNSDNTRVFVCHLETPTSGVATTRSYAIGSVSHWYPGLPAGTLFVGGVTGKLMLVMGANGESRTVG